MIDIYITFVVFTDSAYLCFQKVKIVVDALLFSNTIPAKGKYGVFTLTTVSSPCGQIKDATHSAQRILAAKRTQ